MSEACTVFKGLLFLSLFVALIFKNQDISYHPFLYLLYRENTQNRAERPGRISISVNSQDILNLTMPVLVYRFSFCQD